MENFDVNKFEFAEEFLETYPETCQFIWDELKSLGKVYLDRRNLENLWRDFSDEEYDAGFLMPDKDSIKQFAMWLKIRRKSMKVFVTSDTHFGHNNIIRYCNRPFKDTERDG